MTPFARMPDQGLPPDEERWNYYLSRCRMCRDARSQQAGRQIVYGISSTGC
jgi:hypothetical protein